MSTSRLTFTPLEFGWALGATMVIQVGLLATLALAGASHSKVRAEEAPAERAIPIAVKPVLDDLPLLKLGGKKVRAKLPDMWKKNPPVQRFEEASAPSPQADLTPQALPTSPLAKPDAEAPPPDAEVAAQVEQVLLDAGPQDASVNTEGEGSPDGVKEGTETDPAKAAVRSLYLSKIHAWFQARFRQPDIPCEELKTLRSAVVAQVGQNREITGFDLVRPSGNATFDERVRSTMANIVGQELPPPPPLYPDLLNTTVRPIFGGKCNE